VEALLAEAHPLAREPEVHREVEPHQRAEPRREAEHEADAHRHLAPDLERGEERRVRQHSLLEKLLVPANGIPCRELRHPLRVKADEARRAGEIWEHTPGEGHGELGPHCLDEPNPDDDAQQCEPPFRRQHDRGQCT
jgi:hypothetical protein